MSQIIKCEVCGYENPSDHNYCGRCGNEIAGGDQITSTSIINAPIQGDRRQVTIIFADISGYTALNDAAKTPAEVENMVRLINHLLRDLSEAIYEYDGYIDKYVGDEIMALFGAPTAQENDAELALRAALSMMEKLEEFNNNPPIELPAPLGMHMGINTGTVIAGMVGTDRKRSYTVMGDVVNVAARLEGASTRGKIYVNEDTYNLTNRLFVFEEVEPVTAKGKPEPLKVYQLIAARDLSQTQRGLTDMEAPLIGREYETQILVNATHKLSENQGSIVVVTGDAGLGKSRLIFESMKQFNKERDETQSKPLWLFGRGLSYRQSFQNRLFVDILYSYLDLPENADDVLVKMRLEAMGDEIFGERKNDVIPYLATMAGIKLNGDSNVDLPLNDPQLLQQRIFIAMGEWAEMMAAQQPLILAFEDLHWADQSSVALIEYLFSLTLYNPILMVCVSRLERRTNFWQIKTKNAQEYGDIFTELTLWPLTDEESRQLIKHLLKIEPMPEAMENLLLNRAEGNPLFLEEVIRSLIEEDVIQRADDHWEITRSATEVDIPNTLQGVLTARIDRLDENVKRVLQVAAVIGRVFPRFILEPIINDSEILEKALAQLEVSDLIEVKTRDPEPEYIFKHVLTYETAYNSLLHQRRKLIHKQIGDYMSRLYWQLGEQYAPIVADHYYKSETWPRALRYLHRAAEAAIQSFANEEAIKYYTRALEVADLLGDEADPNTILKIYEGRAKMLTRMGEPQSAMKDYEAALAKAKESDDNSAQIRALNGNGVLHASHHNFIQASEFFQQALSVARRIEDERGIAITLNLLGDFYYNMGRLEQAIKCYRESCDLSIKLNNEAGRITSEDGLAKIMLEQGEIKASLERYETDIIPVRHRLGYRSGLMNSLYAMLMGQVFVANYDKAEEIAQELLELQRKSGDLSRMSVIKFYQAFAQLYKSHLDEAGKSLLEGLKVAQEHEQKSFQALGMAWLGYYYLTIGLDEKGLEQAEQSFQIAQELGSPLYVMKTQSILGTAYRHLNRLEEAVKELETVLAVAHKMGFAPDEVMILYQLSRAYVDIEAWDKAEASVKNLLDLATASEMREFMARGQWLKSILETQAEQYDDALESLVLASNLAQETDSRLSQYMIQIQKANIYLIAGNEPASRDAMIYAQRIQRKLLENNLTDKTKQQAFLNTIQSRKLQTIVEAHA